MTDNIAEIAGNAIPLDELINVYKASKKHIKNVQKV